uniref:Uncharacterized protein n=1 Tax=Rhizophagus irregularis (strain DAOM 181602 / DAOM 197198 / MUCL 43194) TaxID=747089 RepID=U9TP32_RHIID
MELSVSDTKKITEMKHRPRKETNKNQYLNNNNEQPIFYLLHNHSDVHGKLEAIGIFQFFQFQAFQWQ